MKRSLFAATQLLSCLVAASGWAGEELTIAETLEPSAEYSAGDSVADSSALGQPIRPCLCHGAYAGSESEKALSFNLTGGYDSSYLCRGLDVGDDLFHVTGTLDYRLTDKITWTGSILYRYVTEVDFHEFNFYTGLFFSL